MNGILFRPCGSGLVAGWQHGYRPMYPVLVFRIRRRLRRSGTGALTVVELISFLILGFVFTRS